MDQEYLKRLIKDWAPKLIPTEGINPVKLLCAILHNESSYGKDCSARFEKAYGPGGRYYRKSYFVREKYEKYKDAACCSYGPFQILYITACELGFKDNPQQLSEAKLSIPYVVEYLNRRILRKPGNETVRQIADAYNSGSFEDLFIPEKYMDDFEEAYNSEEFMKI